MQQATLTELDSGERLVTEKLDHVRSVALGFFIGAGSRDETDAKAGITHLIEHLLFKGTDSYTAQEIAETFDALGGELNAATSREHTVVYTRVPDEKLEIALDVMAEMVFQPVFAELETEREVVLEEIAMVEDTPSELVHDLLSEAVFGDDPLGRPVIGTAEVISTVDEGTIADYHRSTYVPGNVVLAAAGNLEHERLVELVERSVAKLPTDRANKRVVRGPLVRRRRRACASGARRPSSTTSASARPASRAPTSAASPPRCSTRSSAGRPRRACSRRSARSAGWRTPSTPSCRSTPTPARSASTSARARRTWPPASRSRRSRSPTWPRGTCARPSSSGRRTTSRAGSCSRWSRPRTG